MSILAEAAKKESWFESLSKCGHKLHPWFSSYFVINYTLRVFLITIQRYVLAHYGADAVAALQFLVGKRRKSKSK